ncbi:MAG: helix-turn-helix transcriptional regulator [Nitrospirae bacterium]|nr:helix-turn-helix transcriptional regulator [Nitrospirota bacterium]
MVVGKKGDPELSRIFGKNVRRARLSGGLTQEDLAERANLAVNYISDLEAGKRNPGLDVVARLARALDRPIEILCNEQRKESSMPRATQTPWAIRINSLVGSLDPRTARQIWQFLNLAFGRRRSS